MLCAATEVGVARRSGFMLSRMKPSSSSSARIASRPPGTQHSDAHSMILAMCTLRPVGKPSIVGSDAKIAVSQARPAMMTSTSAAKARRKLLMPIWPTILAALTISSSVSGGMSSRPMMRPAFDASNSIGRGMSARITAMRKDSPSVRAISRIISTVASRCAAAPADPAEPMTKGMSSDRAPCSTLRRSRRVASGEVAISPLPR